MKKTVLYLLLLLLIPMQLFPISENLVQKASGSFSFKAEKRPPDNPFGDDEISTAWEYTISVENSADEPFSHADEVEVNTDDFFGGAWMDAFVVTYSTNSLHYPLRILISMSPFIDESNAENVIPVDYDIETSHQFVQGENSWYERDLHNGLPYGWFEWTATGQNFSDKYDLKLENFAASAQDMVIGSDGYSTYEILIGLKEDDREDSVFSKISYEASDTITGSVFEATETFTFFADAEFKTNVKYKLVSGYSIDDYSDGTYVMNVLITMETSL